MKRKLAILVALVMAVALLTPTAVLAASVTPTLIPGAANPPPPTGDGVCTELRLEADQDQIQDGEYSDGTLTVTIEITGTTGDGEPNEFSWTSNIPVSVVYVKDGVDGTYAYDYRPAGSNGDTGLTTPPTYKGISHISFFYCDEDNGNGGPNGIEVGGAVYPNQAGTLALAFAMGIVLLSGAAILMRKSRVSR